MKDRRSLVCGIAIGMLLGIVSTTLLSLVFWQSEEENSRQLRQDLHRTALTVVPRQGSHSPAGKQPTPFQFSPIDPANPDVIVPPQVEIDIPNTEIGDRDLPAGAKKRYFNGRPYYILPLAMNDAAGDN